MKLFLSSTFFLFLLILIPFSQALVDIQPPFDITINVDAGGGITNISEAGDTDIDSPSNNFVLTFNSTSGLWEDRSAAAVGDSNETTRFNNLVNDDCPAGQVVLGVQTNGTVTCVTDADSGSVNIFDQVLNTTSNVSFNNVTTAQFVSASNFLGNLTWSFLNSYPTTCTASQYISVLGDTITCASILITTSQISDFTAGVVTVIGNFFDQEAQLNTTGSPRFANLNLTGNLSFDGEILPDGLVCSDGQILKKTGANNWDCAADDTSEVSYDLNVSGDEGSGTIEDGEVFNILGSGIVSTNMTSDNNLTITGTAHTTDTNDTTRVDALNATACSGTDKVSSILLNGTIVCTADADSGATNIFDQVLNTTSNVTFFNVTAQNFIGEADPVYVVENSTIARTGDCPSGQFVQNTTTGGVECATVAGSGDITNVQGDSYITNGSASGDVNLVFNDTKLNLTIDARDTNETTRFNTLVGNCSAGEQVFGVHDDGTRVCVTDADSGTTNLFDQVLNTTSNVSFNNVTVTENVTASWFLGFIDWTNIVNKFIESVSGNFLFMSGTELNFNDTLLNNTIDLRDTNDTIRVDALNQTSCSGTDKVSSFLLNGTIVCTTDVDSGATNIFDQFLNTTSNVTFNNVTTTQFVSATTFLGNLAWSFLNSYPSACSTSETITTIGDTITCTAISIAISQITDIGDANVNRSDWWDGLNTPADINTADITDDNTYMTVAGDTGTGNFIFNQNLTVDTDTLFIDSNSNQVGINTTTPSHELNVVGFSNFTQNVTFGDCIIFSNGGQICQT